MNIHVCMMPYVMYCKFGCKSVFIWTKGWEKNGKKIKCQRSIFTLKLHVRWWNNCALLCSSPFGQNSECHVHVYILLLTAISSLMMDEWSNDRLGAHGFQEEVDGIAWLTDAGMRHVARNFPNTTTLEISHCPLLSNPILWFLPGKSPLLIVHSRSE